MSTGHLLFPLLMLLFGLPGPVLTAAAYDKQPPPITLRDYFFTAARSGEVSVLQEFMKSGFPADERNGQSYTALMIAAYQGQLEAVQVLLEGGANPCLRDKRGHTALMGAVIKGEWRIAKHLYAIDCDRESGSCIFRPIMNTNSDST